MVLPEFDPWFREAVDSLDLRRRDRVLMVTASRPGYVRSLSRIVAGEGFVLLVEPDRSQAQRVADLELENVEVLALEPKGSEQFGTFDALFACPMTMPLWPLGLWGDLASYNLRPGGRFVIDLPAERMSDDLARTWEEIGGSTADLQPLLGASERELAASLRTKGLRQIEAAMGTHLLAMESPGALAEMGRKLMGADRDRGEELAVALTRRLETTGPVDVVIRRTRVHGIR